MGLYAMSVTPSSRQAAITPLRSGARYVSEYCTWLDASGTPRSCHVHVTAVLLLSVSRSSSK